MSLEEGLNIYPITFRIEPTNRSLCVLAEQLRKYLVLPEAVTVQFEDEHIGPKRFICIRDPSGVLILISAKLSSSAEKKILAHGARSVRASWVDRNNQSGGFVELNDANGGSVKSAYQTKIPNYEVDAWEVGGAFDYNPFTSPAATSEQIEKLVNSLSSGQVDLDLTQTFLRQLQNTLGVTIL